MRTSVNELQPGRRYAWNEQQEREWHPDIKDEWFWAAARDVWDYTVVATAHLWNIYTSCEYVLRRKIPGDIVECGVFLGGSIMFFAEVCKRFDAPDRMIYGLDTFTGFVRRSAKDIDFHGTAFGAPSERPTDFFDAATANVSSVGWPSIRLVKGDVAETATLVPSEDISILRLDTDTHDTTLIELDVFYPRVSDGGVVIVDDYGWARGQRDAVDEYFASEPVCLFRIDQYCSAFIKR